MIKSKDDEVRIIDVFTIKAPISALGILENDKTVEIKTFTYRYLKYYYINDHSSFKLLKFPNDFKASEYHDKFGKGLSSDTLIQTRNSLYGPCLIDVPIPSIISLVSEEVSHPFFVFQALSVILWCIEEYYLYSAMILFLSVVSVGTTVYEIRTGISSIRAMAHYECLIKVFRNSKWVEINSKYLVPGDLIKLPEHIQIPCDVILLSGYCIVDESMLTGESQPSPKEPLPTSVLYNPQNKKHLISAGTKSLSYKGECTGIVLSIGFNTGKGELIRSILFPKPNRFGFVSDSMKFLGFMGCVALVGFIWTLFYLSR